MSMKSRAALMLLAAVLSAPGHAAAGALTQARAVASDPINFDGGRVRPEGDPVPASGPSDRRTAAQIAKDEQVKADARARGDLAAPAAGPDAEIAPPKPKEWLKADHLVYGAQGALMGLVIGSIWGLTGLGVGLLVGGLIGYAVSRLSA